MSATRYAWATDAAKGTIEAESPEAALAMLVAQNEWPSTAQAERRCIADGGWLAIGTPWPEVDWLLVRGEMP